MISIRNPTIAHLNNVFQLESRVNIRNSLRFKGKPSFSPNFIRNRFKIYAQVKTYEQLITLLGFASPIIISLSCFCDFALSTDTT